MKRVLLALTLAFASPVHAQDRMSEDHCIASFAGVETMLNLPAGETEVSADNQGWCLATDVTFYVDETPSFRLNSLRWRASGLERFINDQLPPRSLELKVEGIGTVVQTGDPVLDYLYGLQSMMPEAGLGLTVRWDGVQNTIIVDDAFLHLDQTNRISATARIDGANLTNAQTVQASLGTMGLKDLTVTGDFAGWFEELVAFPIGSAVLENNDVTPEMQVAALKEQAIQLLDGVPENILPTASRSAFSAFIETLPRPRGTLRLQLNANPSIGASRLMPFAFLSNAPTSQEIIELGLDGVTFMFTWSPKGK